ncbi:hypothetical protein [Streptomyces sp. TRM68367]|uniref:hypothetical protein n=1 Tax=Streptomyces sp. TRM68367 TaxID=2758415 RepID=UPI00165BAAA4|nr:hypothetical protein [Streptomyces sp. TRM68367]MBC9729891.1 hypothetical protein [Streptomyces sp. TRM68367]
MSSTTTTGEVLMCVALSTALYAALFVPFCLLMNRDPEKDTRTGHKPDAGGSTPPPAAYSRDDFPHVQILAVGRPVRPAGRHRMPSRKETVR